jgi:hypothetical protein
VLPPPLRVLSGVSHSPLVPPRLPLPLPAGAKALLLQGSTNSRGKGKLGATRAEDPAAIIAAATPGTALNAGALLWPAAVAHATIPAEDGDGRRGSPQCCPWLPWHCQPRAGRLAPPPQVRRARRGAKGTVQSVEGQGASRTPGLKGLQAKGRTGGCSPAWVRRWRR